MGFQRNPLTQKDWNRRESLSLMFIRETLPEESIDTEGLKLVSSCGEVAVKIASRGIHWHRRIETLLVLPTYQTFASLPEESIDTEGLKHTTWIGTTWPNPSSRGIHWHRRIETELEYTNAGKQQSFQRNPLTQKDWNYIPLNHP